MAKEHGKLIQVAKSSSVLQPTSSYIDSDGIGQLGGANCSW
uniref:Uncharacterized protein n=1 Tax=Peronospora matthiolae TaxID=2874970 RepID=A0AAV1U4D6_9STRA